MRRLLLPGPSPASCSRLPRGNGQTRELQGRWLRQARPHPPLRVALRLVAAMLATPGTSSAAPRARPPPPPPELQQPPQLVPQLLMTRPAGRQQQLQQAAAATLGTGSTGGGSLVCLRGPKALLHAALKKLGSCLARPVMSMMGPSAPSTSTMTTMTMICCTAAGRERTAGWKYSRALPWRGLGQAAPRSSPPMPPRGWPWPRLGAALAPRAHLAEKAAAAWTRQRPLQSSTHCSRYAGAWWPGGCHMGPCYARLPAAGALQTLLLLALATRIALWAGHTGRARPGPVTVTAPQVCL
jgi:hypothetical protein